jgi:hypothetical protein
LLSEIRKSVRLKAMRRGRLKMSCIITPELEPGR